MIVVDTSAVLAVLQGEPEAEVCRDSLLAEDRLLMAAGTFTETMILAAARGLTPALRSLLDAVPITVIPLTEERASLAARAYVLWGKGFHSAKLNFGDCFAYALAKEQDCPLLFIGNDFSLTDVVPALGGVSP